MEVRSDCDTRAGRDRFARTGGVRRAVVRSGLASTCLLAVGACSSAAPPTVSSDPPETLSVPAPTAVLPASPTSPPGDGLRPTGCFRERVHTAPLELFDAARRELDGVLAPSLRSARIDTFLASVAAAGGTPLESPSSNRVVVLARGAPPSGAWAVTTSEVGFDVAAATKMVAVGGKDLWAAELTVPPDRSFQYKLLSGETFLEDPLAGHVAWDGVERPFGVRGEMNGVGHPAALPPDRGRLVSLGKQHATSLGDDREVYVYLPPRYDDGSCERLPSVLFHDGNEAITRGDFPGVADALYRARPELSAVLVFVGLPSQDVRSAQYGFGEGYRARDYVDFLAGDLWPVLRTRVRVCEENESRGISGASLGGLVSTFAAFERPSTWGWVGAQSASFFWDNEGLVARARTEPRLSTRFYLDSGCPADNCEVTGSMATAMRDRGYDVKRVTVDGAGHEWSAWHARLPGMLTHFREGRRGCR